MPLSVLGNNMKDQKPQKINKENLVSFTDFGGQTSHLGIDKL